MATAEKRKRSEEPSIRDQTHLMVQNPLAENVGKLSVMDAPPQKQSHGEMGHYGLI